MSNDAKEIPRNCSGGVILGVIANKRAHWCGNLLIKTGIATSLRSSQ